jgi:isopentenyl-diphosphate delta-isomerase
LDNTKIKIALVDTKDNIIGYADKIQVHQQGLLHRAFSIFIFNNNMELLLQKRAASKYHSPLLWTNTCCSHFIEGKEFVDYAHERLVYEMGIKSELKYIFKFHYKIHFDNNLIENEIDHVFFGIYNSEPSINTLEVDDFIWINFQNLRAEVKLNPQLYTYWFKESLNHFSSKQVSDFIKNQNS